MTPLRRLFAVFFLALGLFANAAQAAAPTVEDSARQIWQLLDYLAVDYAGAVDNGKVIAADEYAEMQEFAQTAGQQLAGLPDKPEKTALLAQAASLKGAIAAKAFAGTSPCGGPPHRRPGLRKHAARDNLFTFRP